MLGAAGAEGGSFAQEENLRWREGEAKMDMATILPWVILAVGGAVGGNVLGAVTRGGGGLAGRTIIGAIGGVAAGYAAGLGADAPGAVPAVHNLAGSWQSLIQGEYADDLGNLITGALGGGVLGLVGGLLIRSRG